MLHPPRPVRTKSSDFTSASHMRSAFSKPFLLLCCCLRCMESSNEPPTSLSCIVLPWSNLSYGCRQAPRQYPFAFGLRAFSTSSSTPPFRPLKHYSPLLNFSSTTSITSIYLPLFSPLPPRVKGGDTWSRAHSSCAFPLPPLPRDT